MQKNEASYTDLISMLKSYLKVKLPLAQIMQNSI